MDSISLNASSGVGQITGCARRSSLRGGDGLTIAVDVRIPAGDEPGSPIVDGGPGRGGPGEEPPSAVPPQETEPAKGAAAGRIEVQAGGNYRACRAKSLQAKSDQRRGDLRIAEVIDQH